MTPTPSDSDQPEVTPTPGSEPVEDPVVAPDPEDPGSDRVELSLAKSGNGKILLSPAPIDSCGDSCFVFTKDTIIKLRARAGRGNRFIGWSIDPGRLPLSCKRSVTDCSLPAQLLPTQLQINGKFSRKKDIPSGK